MTPLKPRFCSSKAIEHLRSLLPAALQTGAPMCFLVLSGSFNPIHRQHLRMLELARDHLAARGWIVLGGFIAPSTDGYVHAKLGKQAMSLEHRIRLCEVAVQHELSWATVCQTGEARSGRVCGYIRTEIEISCADLLSGRSLVGVEVMGSDAALRIFNKLLQDPDESAVGSKMCCFLRLEQEPAKGSMLEDFLGSCALQLGIELFVLRDSENALLSIANSTAIRTMLANKDWQSLRLQNTLPPAVLAILQDWYGSADTNEDRKGTR
jgi:nicotinic acid mononucleotide adenylyltransferase